MLVARDYQESANNAVFSYFRKGGTGNPLVALPTGTGKAFSIAYAMQTVYKTAPTARMMMLTHVIELIEQNYEELKNVWPTAPAGIYSDGLGRKEHFYPITFAGIASVAKNARLFGRIDIIFIDEAHLVSPKETTMYRTFINELLAVNPKLKVIGYTATKYRVGQGLLIEPGGLFTDLCFDGTTFEGFNWFIDQGYLVPLFAKRTATEQDLDGVGIIGGEFNQKQLQAASNTDKLNRACVMETIQVGREENRAFWLVFATGIEHTEAVCNEFVLHGINATFVHSKMPKNERRQRIKDFRDGKYQCMVNNGILTTGFNKKDLDLISVMRATRSPGLWVQILGRGTRPMYAEGFDLTTQVGRLEAIRNSFKRSCRVLDFAGNSRRLGPINDPRVPLPPKAKKRPGDMPVKICDGCGTYNHPSVRFCACCGAEFPRESKLLATSSTEDVIRLKVKMDVKRFDVQTVIYNCYFTQKVTAAGVTNIPSIKVTYHCGNKKNFDEYVCLEHGGTARKRAERWWRERTNSDAPATVMEALGEIKSLREPAQLDVWINKQNKYPEIMNYVYRTEPGCQTGT